MAEFFINRPIFASVISIVIVLAGLISLLGLPIAQFPEITPPQVEVKATYTGASAEVVEQTVATPIEQEVNGVDDMIYMSSQSSNDGVMVLTVTFKVGSDVDQGTVNIQNRVAIAQPKLPQEVLQSGVTTKKKSSNLLMVATLNSTDEALDEIFLSNYATINILDQLKRLPGVGDAMLFGGRDYGMRIWLNPDRLTSMGLTVNDVSKAIQEQNIQFPAGQIGQPPAPPGQEFQYSVRAKGRLTEVEEFEDIILRTGTEGSVVRVKDVARVELGAQLYTSFGRLNGRPVRSSGSINCRGRMPSMPPRTSAEHSLNCLNDFPKESNTACRTIRHSLSPNRLRKWSLPCLRQWGWSSSSSLSFSKTGESP